MPKIISEEDEKEKEKKVVIKLLDNKRSDAIGVAFHECL